MNSFVFLELEPRARVELATCRLRIGCSTTELPRPLIINDLFPCLRDFHRTFIVLSSVSTARCLTFTRKCPTCSERCCAVPDGDRNTSASDTLPLFLECTTESDRAPDARKIAK